MAQTHYFPTDQVHFTWDTGHEPVITIADGDTVVIETRDVSDNQIGPDSDASVIAGLDWDRVYPLAGPIRVEGAAPGRHARGRDPRPAHARLGLDRDPPRPRPAGRRLPRRLPEDLRHLRRRRSRSSATRSAIPLTPFMGTMGVCPADASAVAGHAARALRRQHGHAPARARHDALPAGRGRGRDASPPATRTAARATARSASPASRRRCTPSLRFYAREGPQPPRAAVPHGAGPAHPAASTTARSTAPPASGPTSTRARRTRCGR